MTDQGAAMNSQPQHQWKFNRRQALQIGAAGSLAAAVGARALPAGASTSFTPLSHPAAPRPNLKKPIGTDLIPKIKHIVVVMLENQSYDSILGTLSVDGVTPHGDGLTWGANQGARAKHQP